MVYCSKNLLKIGILFLATAPLSCLNATRDNVPVLRGNYIPPLPMKYGLHYFQEWKIEDLLFLKTGRFKLLPEGCMLNIYVSITDAISVTTQDTLTM